MVYFIKGELPWQNIKAKSRKEKYSKIYQMKKKMVPDELCNFLPEEMKTFLNYILNLNVKIKPDYSKLINLINNLMNKYSYSNDLQFDWYSSSFLQKLYSTPVIDDGEKLKSTSIYEEDSSNSDINIKKLKANRNHISNSNKKNKPNNNHINKMNNYKFGSIKNIKHINKQCAFSPNYMKNSVNLNENDNEKDEYKNLRFSINNHLNEDIFNRQRLSSY